MKKSHLIMFILFCSCSATKKIYVQYNQFHETGDHLDSGIHGKVIMTVPKPAKVRRYRWEGITMDYHYLDSSLIYLSNAFYTSTPNDSLIRYDKGRSLKGLWPDTISFSGVDANGRYWKEIKYMDVYYGYSNVPANKIELVENIIRSVRIK